MSKNSYNMAIHDEVWYIRTISSNKLNNKINGGKMAKGESALCCYSSPDPCSAVCQSM